MRFNVQHINAVESKPCVGPNLVRFVSGTVRNGGR